MASEPRVLIVENHDVLRVMLFTILRHQPLAVDTAATASDAMQKVLGCDYALIVIDMDMPDGDAEQFLESFYASRPDATTFVLAVRDPRGESFADPALVSAVISKPIELDTMADLVRETAQAVPPPEDPLPCPAAESDIRGNMDRTPYMPN